MRDTWPFNLPGVDSGSGVVVATCTGCDAEEASSPSFPSSTLAC